MVFVSYGHPALAAPGTSCPGGRDGFDVHPAFGADPQRLRQVVDFVSERVPAEDQGASRMCDGKLCRDPATDRMTFVDGHQAAFAQHGVCARSDEDPEFDRDCFSPNGESFRTDPAQAATDPLACGRQASEFRPYAPRARWVRTANDSYFTAMTYPQGLSSVLQPASIHDATWGVLSRGLWRRHPSDRRRPRRHGRRGAAGDARRARHRRPGAEAAQRHAAAAARATSR